VLLQAIVFSQAINWSGVNNGIIIFVSGGRCWLRRAKGPWTIFSSVQNQPGVVSNPTIDFVGGCDRMKALEEGRPELQNGLAKDVI